MRNILLGLMFLMVGLSAFAKDDKKIIYLGDDRYTCRGDGCDAFMARERQAQASRARNRERDRDYGGYNESREQRQRERDSDFDVYDSSAWRR